MACLPEFAVEVDADQDVPVLRCNFATPATGEPVRDALRWSICRSTACVRKLLNKEKSLANSETTHTLDVAQTDAWRTLS